MGKEGGGVKYLKLLFILVYNIPNVMIFYMLPQKWRGGATPSNSFSNFKKLSEKVPHPTPLMLRACISLFTFDQLVLVQANLYTCADPPSRPSRIWFHILHSPEVIKMLQTMVMITIFSFISL